MSAEALAERLVDGAGEHRSTGLGRLAVDHPAMNVHAFHRPKRTVEQVSPPSDDLFRWASEHASAAALDVEVHGWLDHAVRSLKGFRGVRPAQWGNVRGEALRLAAGAADAGTIHQSILAGLEEGQTKMIWSTKAGGTTPYRALDEALGALAKLAGGRIGVRVYAEAVARLAARVPRAAQVENENRTKGVP